MSSKKEKKKKETLDPKASLFPFQLVDVRLYEINVERCEPQKENESEVPDLKVLLHSGSEPPEAENFSLLLTFETNFLFEDNTPTCKLFMAIEGFFVSVVDVDTIKPEVVSRFKETDALILLWPYLRQMLHDLTTRLRLDVPPLPLIDPGTLVTFVSQDESERDAAIA
jgi:preprotein translocase subunit SecB